jgi:hypothetical protein
MPQGLFIAANDPLSCIEQKLEQLTPVNRFIFEVVAQAACLAVQD